MLGPERKSTSQNVLRFCSALRITAYNAQEGGEFGEMCEGLAARRRVRTAEEVRVESVFPRTAAPRTRFDFREADVSQGKYGEAAEQRARHVVRGEDDEGLVCFWGRVRRAPHEKKAREIAAVVLDVPGQDARPVGPRGGASGDPCGVATSLLDNLFHASRRVVGRHGLHVLVPREELAALRQRNRVRVHLSYITQANAARRDQHVLDQIGRAHV